MGDFEDAMRRELISFGCEVTQSSNLFTVKYKNYNFFINAGNEAFNHPGCMFSSGDDKNVKFAYKNIDKFSKSERTYHLINNNFIYDEFYIIKYADLKEVLLCKVD